MAVILGHLHGLYHTVFTEWGDPRSNDFFLMSSPLPGVALLGFYLYFVQNLGPRLMKDRKPLELKTVMICYNTLQIILCSYISYKAFDLAWCGKYRLLCEPIDYSKSPEAMEILRATHLYFLIKVTDLLDTVFFVLRKKNSHVSFLHVYHHTGMVMLGWSGTKYMAGGHGTFLGFINSIVHVIMYSYYLLTLLNDEYKNSFWIKKRITQMQIIQFLLLVLHFGIIVLIPNCAYPRWTAAVMVPQNLFMLILFLDFYRKAYHNISKKETVLNVNGNIANNGISLQSNGKCKEDFVLLDNDVNRKPKEA